MNRKTVLIVVVLLLVLAAVTIGTGCTALDPCVRQRDTCYKWCKDNGASEQDCHSLGICETGYRHCKGGY